MDHILHLYAEKNYAFISNEIRYKLWKIGKLLEFGHVVLQSLKVSVNLSNYNLILHKKVEVFFQVLA